MFDRKLQLVTYLDELNNTFNQTIKCAPELFSSIIEKFNKELVSTKNNVRNGELLIPIIGGFSAGKSTILNKIIGKDVLPVAVTAETAIPAEIRYSEDEYLITIDINNKQECHSLSMLSSLSQNAGHYQVVKVFVNSPEIKKIEPFTFVDMPGFNSHFAHHNDAILRYLNRGSFYFYFINCQDGTLNHSDLRRLNEIHDMDRKFILFTTKTDLMPKTNISKVIQTISDELEDEFSNAIKVFDINHHEYSELTNLLSKLDPDELFNKQFINEIKELYYTAFDSINSSMIALEKTREEKEQQINELRGALKALEKEKDKQLNQINISKIKNEKKKILQRLKNELHQSVESFIISAKSGEDALGRSISDLVRTVLIREFKTYTSQLSDDIAYQLSKSLDFSFNSIQFEQTDWVDNLLESLKQQVMNLLIGSNDEKNKKEGGGILYDLFTAGAMFIPHPAVKVILAILPRVVGDLFDLINESRQKDRYHTVINNEVIPSVLNNVEPKIDSAIDNIQQAITNLISNEFATKLNEQKEIFESANESFNQDAKKNINLIEDFILAKNTLVASAKKHSII
ncbi:dynamin family protein [Providencia stuartii]|uniref:dynamin family protein n=1 Tax=Providencia stuartii TaxID=588 RepID=UPI003828E852